jgi:hypothetical protein
VNAARGPRTCRATLLACLLAGVLPGLAALPGEPRAAGVAPGPALAVEDTMRTEVPEVLVRAPRVTLDEILDRVARGEARRDSAIRDQSFTATIRILRDTAGKGTPEVLAESVSKVYRKKPGLVRTVPLRHYERYPEKAPDEGGMAEPDFSPGMGEELVNFAFRPANRRNFRFRIEDRKLVGDHVVYTLGFEPRSALAVHEPAGRVWVDTRDYVILRQEIRFRQSPVPLFLKSIPHMVVERARAGDTWVLSRALVRMELTVPVPRLGRSLDFGMAFSDHTVNTDLPDSIFAGIAPREDRARVRVRVGSGGRRGS